MSDLDPTRRPDPEDPDESGRVPQDQRLTPENVRRLRSSFIGMALLTAVGFVIVGSLTFLPWWAVVPLVLAWVVLMRAAGSIWFTTNPRRVLITPAWLMLAWLVVALGLGLFTDQVRDEPVVDPFPDPPSQSPSPSPSQAPSQSPSPSAAP